MTLSEYITAEFGIMPDEVQLEQIREIVKDMDKLYIQSEIRKMNTFTPYPINKDF